MKLWCCNFNSQLANALIIEGDYPSSISALQCGFLCAAQICYPELQVCVFTSTVFSINRLYSGPLLSCLVKTSRKQVICSHFLL